MENKPFLTEKEKIALNVLGETNARIMTMDGTTAEDVIKERNRNKFNEAVDSYVEKLNEHATNLEKFAEQVNDNIEKIEIMPIGNYLLVKPFSENPFQRIVKDEKSGLILDLGGQKPQYKNTDNGQIEEEEQFIRVAVVQEVGPDCKWIIPGDTIMYTKPSEVPVPFYKQGLALVNEARVIVTINEGLSSRFKNIKNG